MNKKLIIGLSIIGTVIMALIVGSDRERREREAKIAAEDSINMVKDLFKEELIVKDEDLIK